LVAIATEQSKNQIRKTYLLYQGANQSAIATLTALGSDLQYIKLCSEGKRFMARLTPKIQPELAFQYFVDRSNNLQSDASVCHFLKTIGNSRIDPHLAKTIELHDFLTQCDRLDLKLQ
jgi:hypothetical protein